MILCGNCTANGGIQEEEAVRWGYRRTIWGPISYRRPVCSRAIASRSSIIHKWSSWESVSGSDSVVHVIGLVGILEADRTG